MSSKTGSTYRPRPYLSAYETSCFVFAVRLPASLPSAGAPGVPQKPTSRCVGKSSRPPRGSSGRGGSTFDDAGAPVSAAAGEAGVVADSIIASVAAVVGSADFGAGASAAEEGSLGADACPLRASAAPRQLTSTSPIKRTAVARPRAHSEHAPLERVRLPSMRLTRRLVPREVEETKLDGCAARHAISLTRLGARDQMAEIARRCASVQTTRMRPSPILFRRRT